MKESGYEIIPHGNEHFPIALYSESIYEVGPHYHKEYELFFLTEGTMRFGIDGEECILTANKLAFVEPGMFHYAYHTDSAQPWHYHSLLFDIAALGSEQDPARTILEGVKINRFPMIPEADLSKAQDIFMSMSRHDYGAELSLKAYLYRLLSCLITTRQYTLYADYRKTTQKSNELINNVIRYVEQHFRDKIDINEIAESISYSRSHFNRLFKEKTGLSFVDYLNKYRIEKSCVELLYSTKKINEIAIDNGFNTVQYYSRVFRMYMNNTPADYRRMAMQLQIPHLRS